MQEIPDIPAAPPEIPRGRIWAALLIPSIVVVDGTGIVAVADGGRAGLSVIPLVAACAILVCYAVFWRTLSKRYRGPSMVLMEAGYLFGQMMVCAMVGWLSWWLFFSGI